MSTLTNNEFRSTQIYGDLGVNMYPKNVLNLGLFSIDTTNNTIYIGKNDNSTTIYLYGNIINADSVTGWYGTLYEGYFNQFYTDTSNFLNQFITVQNNYYNQFT